MKRALFVFAKLNRGLRYVQGMNELLAPIYYQFRNDTHEDNKKYAEADSFYCFLDLISEFRDHFCQQLVSHVSTLPLSIAQGSPLPSRWGRIWKQICSDMLV